MGRIIICAECGKEKLHKAGGLCKNCYQRQWHAKNGPVRKSKVVICAECGEEKICEARGLCIACYKRWRRKRGMGCLTVCADCGHERIHEAHGLCKSCWSHRYYLEHREERRAYDSRWRQKNPEKARAKSRRYVEKHQEETRLYKRQWHQEHKEERAEYMRIWWRNNPEKSRIYGARRRRQEQNLPNTLTKNQITGILSTNRCFYCGEIKALTLDHFVPIGRDDNQACGTTLANSVAACRSCNSWKKDKMPEDILKQLSFT